ncbi:HAD family hydrolase [Endozoicomonas lisbonensis]|uniref:phosphoglycolate phosphatase n=1 Tax=Endozoicomonas lisbonensis TaxID=3120522 RepID=A0ABV2SCI4_9GAMM
MSQKVVLFDMDGVIADSWQAFYPVFSEYLNKTGFNDLVSEAVLLEMFEGNFYQNLQTALHPCPVNQTNFLQLSLALTTAIKSCSPFPGIKQALQQLNHHYPLYLITNNFNATASVFLEEHRLNVFQEVLGLETHRDKTVKIARIQAQYPDHSVFFISDTLGDILEARQTEAVTIAISWGWHSRQTLLRGSPDTILDTPDELLDYIIHF